MRIRKLIIKFCSLFMAGIMLLASGCAGAATAKNSGISASSPPAKIEGKDFLIRNSDGSYSSRFLSGVNIGAAKAGYFPGEFGVTEEDYLRWFSYISGMNVRVIRVYVNQMPTFYDALKKFNDGTDKPLYLLHGVYMDEDLIAKYNDAFGGNGAIADSFKNDIQNAADIIHGNAVIEKKPGNAGGMYTSDVSRWVIGWILGIEWSAEFVEGTNDANPDRTSFSGDYVTTENASPFEAFLAQACEEAISYEMKNYSVQRPVAVTNWCTTDPLEHPNEPNPEMEDAVSVDVEHIKATGKFTAGFFASYHVYPYYPDFLSYDTGYSSTDDPYLAYLRELNAYHSMPVLISEYGIPSARGVAHKNAVTGMSQGSASEKQQADWIMSMDKDIQKAGCAGGLIFTWQDEWFKRTWNSMDYESADRRPYWHNVQSPEQNFGLLAFDPGEKTKVVTVDGNAGEWKSGDLVTENDGIKVYAKSDAEYLYLMAEGTGYDFDTDTLYLPIGVLSGQGNTKSGDLSFADGAEFLLRLSGKNDSAVLVDAYYDVFQFDYSVLHDYYDPVPGQTEKNSGDFDPIYLAMNRPQTLPETGVKLPFERFDTGKLTYGCADPESGDYNSLADFCAGDKAVEIRIPWMLIGFMDPSTKQVMGDFNSAGSISPAQTDGVKIGVCRAHSTAQTPMALYTWDGWDMPATHERLKQSYYILKDFFAGNG